MVFVFAKLSLGFVSLIYPGIKYNYCEWKLAFALLKLGFESLIYSKIKYSYCEWELKLAKLSLGLVFNIFWVEF